MATMSLQAAYDQARSYLEANKVEQALGVAQHILEYFPENLEAHRILGEAYLASRQFDQAEAAFGRVLHADPENIPAHVGLGITFERQGKLDRAVVEFEQALEVRPDMPELRGQLLRLYTDLWGAEGATLRLSRPGLARLYAKGHMLPQAIQEFRSVIDEHPDRFDARVGLAEALWRDGQEDAAAETCEAILAERADVLKANLLLGYIRLASGDEGGDPYWRLAQQLDPYQQVARQLFEALPDVPPPDLDIPTWDETVWLEQRAREEEQRRAAPADAVDASPAFGAATALGVAGAAAASDDEDGFESWLDQVEEPSDAAPLSSPPPAPVVANDDFLATLLALETPPVPVDEGSDLDSSSGVTPFSFDEFDTGEPAPPPPTRGEGPGFDFSEDALLADAEVSPDQGEDLEPFSLADLGLSDEEIAQLGAVTPADVDQAPVTFDDLTQPPAELGEPQFDAELEPFTLAELGLLSEEIAELDAAQPPVPSEPSELAVMEGFDPELEPFSLADLGLSSEELSLLGPEASAPPASPELDLEPFSLDDLGLSSEELSLLGPEASAPPASPELDLEPFSLDDLGLTPDEIASLEAAHPPAEVPMPVEALEGLDPIDWSIAETAEAAPEGGEFDLDLGDLQPFSLDDLDLNALGEDTGIGSLPPSLQPFSLDDLPSSSSASAPALPDEPDEPSETSGGYSWQQPAAKGQTDFVRGDDGEPTQGSIFGRLKQWAAERPPEEELPLPAVSDDDAAAAGYFSNDDVPLRDDEPGAADRFAGGFRLPKEGEAANAAVAAAAAAGAVAGVAAAAGAAKDEPPPAPPVDATPLAAEGAEPELTPFSLEDLGLSPEEIAQLEGAVEAAPEAGLAAGVPGEGEPELTPFSLEDLGLSLEEIALLEGAVEAAPEAAALGEGEPELTPFSLEDLGLSPEEIALLEAADHGDLSLPATGDTIVPGWSQGEEPELTPFAPDDVGGAAPEQLMAGIEPFSLDDLDFGETAGAAAEVSEGIDETVGIGVEPFSLADFDFDEGAGATPAAGIDEEVTSGVQPFSLDDLGLNDVGASDDPSRELGLTAEELAGLDLGDFETLLSDPIPTTPLVDEDPTAALERLMALGRAQGYVDLTDIMSVVLDPEAEAERIEEIGWALHNAGIQIRDGDEVIDMEGEAEELEEPDAPAASFEGEPDLTPFSLSELGLSDDEIAALGLGDAAPAAPPEPVAQAEGEPELTPFSLEDLGLSPEEIALLEGAAAEVAPEAAPEAPAAAPAEGEPELTPFSLEDLGLSPEEIALLEGAAAAEVAPEAAPEAPVAAPAEGEPELTPFSLEDLGLSPEEIALLEGAAAAEAVPEAEPSIEDLFDFDSVAAAPVEKVTRRTEPRVEEPPPPVDPADAAFEAEPLDSLDDIWEQPTTPVAAPTAPVATTAEPVAPAQPESTPARVVLPPLGERRREPPPRATPPREPSSARGGFSRDDERFARREAAERRSRSEDRFARRDRRDAAIWRDAPPEPSTPARAVVQEFVGFLPTGDAILDDYLNQLDSEPDNYGLALAIGRLCAQTGRPAIMALAFKRLVRAGEGVAQLTEELEGLIGTIDDPSVKQQLYRLLGDAYSKQGRYREAMSAYSTTFGR